MLIYKIDVLAALKAKGYTTYRLSRERLLGNATVQKLREGKMVGIIELDKICKLLECQPAELIAYEKEPT
jgi:putative transcriptional regulator